jgi:hypothetical protein
MQALARRHYARISGPTNDATISNRFIELAFMMAYPVTVPPMGSSMAMFFINSSSKVPPSIVGTRCGCVAYCAGHFGPTMETLEKPFESVHKEGPWGCPPAY